MTCFSFQDREWKCKYVPKYSRWYISCMRTNAGLWLTIGGGVLLSYSEVGHEKIIWINTSVTTSVNLTQWRERALIGYVFICFNEVEPLHWDQGSLTKAQNLSFCWHGLYFEIMFMPSLVMDYIAYQEWCAKSRYQGQWQEITPHGYCGV